MKFKQWVWVAAFSSAVVGCSSGAPALQTTQDSLGTLVLPLVATAASGATYRLSGQVDVLYHRPDGSLHHVESFSLAGAQTVLAVQLPIGTYDFRLASGWAINQLSGASQQPIDVTPRATLVSASQVTGTIHQTSSFSLNFTFEVAGEVVPFNPCLPDPHATLFCALGDSDGDGLPNGVECVDPTSCEDWDGDGLNNGLDPDSDGDSYNDGVDGNQGATRGDPCLPDAHALTCVAPVTGGLGVDVTVRETCAATGQDSCSFILDAGQQPTSPSVPDAGADAAVDAGQHFIWTGTPPNRDLAALKLVQIATVLQQISVKPGQFNFGQLQTTPAASSSHAGWTNGWNSYSLRATVESAYQADLQLSGDGNPPGSTQVSEQSGSSVYMPFLNLNFHPLTSDHKVAYVHVLLSGSPFLDATQTSSTTVELAEWHIPVVLN